MSKVRFFNLNSVTISVRMPKPERVELTLFVRSVHMEHLIKQKVLIHYTKEEALESYNAYTLEKTLIALEGYPTKGFKDE